MPAGSEPTPAPPLPRTWRPFGPRMASVVFSLILIGGFAWLWINFDQETKDAVTAFQKATGIGLVLLGVGLMNALARCRVTAAEDGLTVVNGYRSRTLAWDKVGAIRYPQGAPWPHVDLGDGEKLSLMGIQSSDGQRAAIAIRELRAIAAASQG